MRVKLITLCGASQIKEIHNHLNPHILIPIPEKVSWEDEITKPPRGPTYRKFNFYRFTEINGEQLPVYVEDRVQRVP